MESKNKAFGLYQDEKDARIVRQSCLQRAVDLTIAGAGNVNIQRAYRQIKTLQRAFVEACMTGRWLEELDDPDAFKPTCDVSGCEYELVKNGMLYLCPVHDMMADKEEGK